MESKIRTELFNPTIGKVLVTEKMIKEYEELKQENETLKTICRALSRLLDKD